MPYKDLATAKAGEARLRARSRAFISEINARTFCDNCGAQPVEWHNPDHVALGRRHYRIGDMASRCRTIAAITAEMARCTPLCRRCHMAADGRLKSFVDSGGARRRARPRHMGAERRDVPTSPAPEEVRVIPEPTSGLSATSGWYRPRSAICRRSWRSMPSRRPRTGARNGRTESDG